MFRIEMLMVLIPAAPLVAAILIPLFASRALRRYTAAAGALTIAAFAVSCVASLLLVREVAYQQEHLSRTGPAYQRVIELWTWADVPAAYQQQLAPPAATAADSVVEGGTRDFTISIALRTDALTAMMLGMVTFISLLVAIFSTGYMTGDRGYWRFFAYMCLFVFSMTMLVSASNFLLLFVFWEAVGVCSYLLIGFWYERPAAAMAGKKAFLVNRVGDMGFALALFLIWITYGTLNYHSTAMVAAADGTTQRVPIDSLHELPADAQADVVSGVLDRPEESYRTGGIAFAICILLLVGACGKSAQFPLHVWLPDAMEGPTPVSALIHAATMVTAGVYMVTRCTPLFMASPDAQLVVSGIGGLTAILAGLIALTQFDLKRVLAYSTVSQLGYMFLGLGVGTFAGITGGMFHLFTHAFFKALLFLGAGSVMHAMGNIIDMRRFGGLRHIMPVTHWTFLVGCLALAGIVPLAGFWSKDAILGAVHDRVHELEHHESEHSAADADRLHVAMQEGAGTEVAATAKVAHHAPWYLWSDASAANAYHFLYWLALFTAGLTAFYTFRAFYLTFYGERQVPPEAGGHAHESPPSMTAPLMVLAICAALVGLAFDRTYTTRPTNLFSDFLSFAPSLATGAVAATRVDPVLHVDVAVTSTIVALVGIALAAFLYLGEAREVRWLTELMGFGWQRRLTSGDAFQRMGSVGWVQSVQRGADRMGLGWLTRFVGGLVKLVLLVLVAPLIVANFVSPYRLSAGKFFFDELYDFVLVRPLRLLANLFYLFDRWVIDGLVNLFGRVPLALGNLMRSLQMGLVQFYALSMVLGALLLILVRILWAQ